MAKIARVFSFQPSYTTTVPDLPKTHRAPNDNAHPFKEQFFTPASKTVAETGKAAVLFVPTAYWTEGRGIEADKCTDTYMEGKLRDQFNAWRDETKVVTVKQVRAAHVKDAKGKIIKVGEITTPEESTNVQRGMFDFVMIARTGKEDKSAFPAEQKPEAGIMCWMRLKDDAKKALAEKLAAEAAALEAEANGKAA